MTKLTAIISVWKRNNVAKQLDAILASSVPPDRIILYQNENHVDVSSVVKEYDIEHYWSKSFNHKYHARFTIPLFVESAHFVIYDDDTIPGALWHEHALGLVEDKNCIAGANGVSFVPELQVRLLTGGVSNNQYNEDHQISDFVGHSWVLRREHIANMWSKLPLDLSTGEDMHLSIVNKLYFGVPTYVPSQKKDDPARMGSTDHRLGSDAHASYKTHNKTTTREDILNAWVAKGWQPAYTARRMRLLADGLRPGEIKYKALNRFNYAARVRES